MPTEFNMPALPDEEETDEIHHVGLYNGVVVNNEDPDELGRVRVLIPGLVEPASAWAWPMGTTGGGSYRRGFFDVPDVGADVMILFLQGDVDYPHYLAGHWGEPDGIGIETPGPDGEIGAKDRVKIKAYETPRYLLIFDHRDGSENVTLRDKETGDEIAIKPDGIEIKTAGNLIATAGGDAQVTAGGQVSIAGATVSMNGPGSAVARLGDSVSVTIPSGTFHVTNPFGPPATIPNPLPVTLVGSIISGSGTVTSG